MSRETNKQTAVKWLRGVLLHRATGTDTDSVHRYTLPGADAFTHQNPWLDMCDFLLMRPMDRCGVSFARRLPLPGWFWWAGEEKMGREGNRQRGSQCYDIIKQFSKIRCLTLSYRRPAPLQ